MRRLRKGQSITDYALAIGLVAITMATMQTFIQRYVQAKIKATTDDVLALNVVDATNGGMLTQLEGTDVRKLNTGLAGGQVVADIQSQSHVDLTETVVGGRRVATAYNNRTGVVRSPSGVWGSRLFFRGVRPMPGELTVRAGRWFTTKQQKELAAKQAQERKQRQREQERLKKQQEEQRKEAWEYTKEQARACYANDKKTCFTGLTRRVMEDPKKFQKFVKRWNRGRGKNDPFRLDPNDPNAVWEKFYGVRYEDAATNWQGSEYDNVPASWVTPEGFTDPSKMPYVAQIFTTGKIVVTPSPGSGGRR